MIEKENYQESKISHLENEVSSGFLEKLKKISVFKEKLQPFKIFKLFILLILVILLGVLILENSSVFSGLRGKKNSWQAVFLSNGQAYFGLIAKETKDVLVLKKVYYLQFAQKQSEGQDGSPQLSIVKLGQEPHGPEDEMRINKEHIIFVEDLKSDSEVVRAIENFEKKR
ncbi:MAG: hypothetical protein N2259_00575 [Patescibacteria group bacterium]|nr:hypothetical protein [Patescibacteria group bacterium]